MKLRTSQTVLFSILGLATIGVSGLVLQPSGVRQVQAQNPLLEGTQIDRQTLAIFERACQNCHSERTEWPWYSHVPPAAWLIQRDVRNARDHLNLSRWQQYSAEERQALLSSIGVVARSGAMPPGRYVLMHRSSRLSSAEREQVYRWTRAERSRRLAGR